VVDVEIFKAARYQAIKAVKTSVFPEFKQSDEYINATKTLR
jgi:hypothetical protein